MFNLTTIHVAKIASSVFMVIGLVLVFGTVGALETDNITIGHAIIQGAASVAVFWLSALGYTKSEEIETQLIEQEHFHE